MTLISPLSLLHPLMVAPLMSPVNVCHMMHAKAEEMGITQRVIQFMDWLRVTTVTPQQGIKSLTTLDREDSTLDQR